MIDTELHGLGLGKTEEQAYRALLLASATDAADLARLLAVPRARLDEALACLADHGFTAPDPAAAPDALPRPTAPAAALRILIHRRQAALHHQSAELERLRTHADRIAGRLMSGFPEAALGDFEVVTGAADIAARADGLLASAEREVLILDSPPYVKGVPGEPSSGTNPPGLGIEDLLERGVTVRAVLDRRGLDYPGKVRCLTELTERGLQARVGTALPTKLIAVDSRTCLLPPTEAVDPTMSALVLGNCLLRNAVLPLFETVWDRATPFGSPGSPLANPQRELLGLLAAGLKDEAIARRLGVHVHTARRRISQLLAELNADTRFQAGAQATLRGWLHDSPVSGVA
ncbi:helix-turn-helix domain-containing protein [Streptomyces sp. NPDC006208]|uniref:TrmB family transcriptional regulator n=1 Tax=Streptomyces sp. NPDC006208 TaxID=3156734 RepID=UPI0033A75AC1